MTKRPVVGERPGVGMRSLGSSTVSACAGLGSSPRSRVSAPSCRLRPPVGSLRLRPGHAMIIGPLRWVQRARSALDLGDLSDILEPRRRAVPAPCLAPVIPWLARDRAVMRLLRGSWHVSHRLASILPFGITSGQASRKAGTSREVRHRGAGVSIIVCACRAGWSCS